MKILFIVPANSDDRTNVSVSSAPYMAEIGKRAVMAPLGVATVAALTPSEHEIFVHDENVSGDVFERLKHERFDILGCSCLAENMSRAMNIFKRCRDEKIPGLRVIGGAGADTAPRDSDAVDVVFFGEAEETWPQFLDEYAKGTHGSFYRQVSKPDMTTSPLPRWDLFDLEHYVIGGVQTTRGCPFDCSFCDVIYIFGRKPRHKPIPQVLEEVRRLEARGIGMIFLTDDDFAGDKEYSKALLRELVKLNTSFNVPLMYVTQADITMAGDKEMLELMADANFVAVLVGVESPNEEALKELNKLQNLRFGIKRGIDEIQAHGILVWGYTIVGADADDATCFKRMSDFVLATNLAHHFCGMLWAPGGTQLWYRMKQQGRVIDHLRSTSAVKVDPEFPSASAFQTNIVPMQMTRIELMEGYAKYLDTVFDPEHFIQRAIGFMENIKRVPRTQVNPIKAMWANRQLAKSMFKHFTIKAPLWQRKTFWKLLFAGLRRDRSLIARALFLYSQYYFNYLRATIAAQLARNQARWEREHPGCIAVMDRDIPVPRAFSTNAKKIVQHAYAVARPRIAQREPMYKALIESLSDYIARWGGELETFDEHHREYVTASMERVLGRMETGPLGISETALPDRPPPGLVREITDGLDLALRFQTVDVPTSNLTRKRVAEANA